MSTLIYTIEKGMVTVLNKDNVTSMEMEVIKGTGIDVGVEFEKQEVMNDYSSCIHRGSGCKSCSDESCPLRTTESD